MAFKIADWCTRVEILMPEKQLRVYRIIEYYGVKKLGEKGDHTKQLLKVTNCLDKKHSKWLRT